MLDKLSFFLLYYLIKLEILFLLVSYQLYVNEFAILFKIENFEKTFAYYLI